MTTIKEYWKLRKLAPMLTVDTIIIEKEKILLIKRATEPFIDHWALPGGFVELNETLEQAATRETKEETGLKTEPIKIVGAYSDPDRDPRGHTVSIVYLMRIISGTTKTTEETKDIRYFPLNRLPENLAFDHKKIIENAKHSSKKTDT